MKNNRLSAMLIVAALIMVTVLTVREAAATTSIASDVDSATRSYTGWAKAIEEEGNAMDSATRSYTDWAKAVEAGNSFVPVTGHAACQNGTEMIPTNVDSATRSYITWAKFLECH